MGVFDSRWDYDHDGDRKLYKVILSNWYINNYKLKIEKVVKFTLETVAVISKPNWRDPNRLDDALYYSY